jgi:gamma-aminobutyric acid receptor subunit beta
MRSGTRNLPRGLTAQCADVLFLFLFVAAGIASAQEPASTLRPSEPGKPTLVYFAMFLIDVDEISSADQSFTANLYYELQWKDPQQAHDRASSIAKPLDAVWNPRVLILNQQKLFKTMSDTVEITPKGDVIYRQRVWGHFSQPLDLREFPMDTQTFEIQLVSARYSPAEVSFAQSPAWNSGIAKRFSQADWDIVSWKITPGAYRHMDQGPGSASITLSLKAKRKVDYYTMNLILPLIFIVAMSWIAFWLHPTESGTQFSVSVTAMLTLMAYRFAVASQLPMISYMTRMDYFTFYGTVLVFLTLIEVVITTMLAKQHNIKAALTIDLWARALFPAAFALLTWAAFFI